MRIDTCERTKNVMIHKWEEIKARMSEERRARLDTEVAAWDEEGERETVPASPFSMPPIETPILTVWETVREYLGALWG
jgi:hypothetical protein